MPQNPFFAQTGALLLLLNQCFFQTICWERMFLIYIYIHILIRYVFPYVHYICVYVCMYVCMFICAFHIYIYRYMYIYSFLLCVNYIYMHICIFE